MKTILFFIRGQIISNLSYAYDIVHTKGNINEYHTFLTLSQNAKETELKVMGVLSVTTNHDQ